MRSGSLVDGLRKKWWTPAGIQLVSFGASEYSLPPIVAMALPTVAGSSFEFRRSSLYCHFAHRRLHHNFAFRKLRGSILVIILSLTTN